MSLLGCRLSPKKRAIRCIALLFSPFSIPNAPSLPLAPGRAFRPFHFPFLSCALRLFSVPFSLRLPTRRADLGETHRRSQLPRMIEGIAPPTKKRKRVHASIPDAPKQTVDNRLLTKAPRPDGNKSPKRLGARRKPETWAIGEPGAMGDLGFASTTRRSRPDPRPPQTNRRQKDPGGNRTTPKRFVAREGEVRRRIARFI